MVEKEVDKLPIELWMNQPEGDAERMEERINLPRDFASVEVFHRELDCYQPTPLMALEDLAKGLGVKGIYVKDESKRFGLNAFKGLGVSYAADRLSQGDGRRKGGDGILVSCTDGNHGKALAWWAWRTEKKAVIFMPKGSEERRVKAIEAYGAQVVVTDMNYDDTVRHARGYAKEQDAHFVQDTALPGYTEIPGNIALGYSTMIREALEQMTELPTHVFLQAGVGSMAGGVIWYLLQRETADGGLEQKSREKPFIGILEADSVACIYESARQGKMVAIGGAPETVMAGLNCGEANPVTFPLLKARANCFIKCGDEITYKGMERACRPEGKDPVFSSGESGAVGLGMVEEILSNPSYEEERKQMKLDCGSVVLLFNTEGEVG